MVSMELGLIKLRETQQLCGERETHFVNLVRDDSPMLGGENRV